MKSKRSTVVAFAADEPQLRVFLQSGRTWDAWREAWERWDARQTSNPIAEFAQALESAPKVAEAPFALTAPANRSLDAAQRGLFGDGDSRQLDSDSSMKTGTDPRQTLF